MILEKMQTPWITLGFSGVCLLLFVITGYLSNFFKVDLFVLYKFGAFYGPAFFDGELYRAVTNSFLHNDLMHFLMNMLFLYVLGNEVENRLKRAEFFGLILASIGGTVLAEMYFSPFKVSVGASGVIFGLAGAMLFLIFFRFDEPVSLRLKNLFALIIAVWVCDQEFYKGFNAVAELSIIPQDVSHSGHLGGAIGGSIFCLWTLLWKNLELKLAWKKAGKVFYGFPLTVFFIVFLGLFVSLRGTVRTELPVFEINHFDGKALEAAINKTKELQIKFPEKYETYTLLAYAYWRSERVASATFQIEHAMKMNPGNSLVRFFKLMIDFSTEKYSDVCKLCPEFLDKKYPFEAAILPVYAESLLYEKRFVESETYFIRAFELDSIRKSMVDKLERISNATETTNLDVASFSRHLFERFKPQIKN